MRVAHNITALNAWRNLNQISGRLGKSVERLSSGYRINKAADDPAGLVLSENLRAQIVGMDQALANTQDGISMVQTAEGSLTEMHSLLDSMRSLALHAANTAAATPEAIAADQEQMDSAIETIDRIATTAAYAGKKLLDGTAGMQSQIKRSDIAQSVEIGNLPETAEGKNTYIHVTLATGAEQAKLGSGQAVMTGASGGSYLGVENDNISAGTQATLGSGIGELTAADTGGIILSNSNIGLTGAVSAGLTIQGIDITGVVGTMTISAAVTHINSQISGIGITVEFVGSAGAGSGLKIITDDYGVDANVSVYDERGLIISAATTKYDSGTNGDTATLNINGTEVTIRGDYTIDSAVAQINSQLSDAGVQVSGALVSGGTANAHITLTQQNWGENYLIDLVDADHIVINSARGMDKGEEGGLARQAQVGGLIDFETALSTAGSGGATLNINGTDVTINAGMTTQEAVDTINEALQAAGVDVTAQASNNNNRIFLRQQNYGSDYNIDLYDPDSVIVSNDREYATGDNIEATLSYSGAGWSGAGTISATGEGLTLKANDDTDFAGLTIVMTETAVGENHNRTSGDPDKYSNVARIYGGALTFQIGANAGETYKATINSMETDELGSDEAPNGLNDLKTGGAYDLSTDPQKAIEVIDQAIKDVSTQRAKLGAIQANVLESNQRNLGVARENLQASESQIRDVDMAKEMMEFTKNNVLAQAATAMLAQANALPNMVLGLLR